MSYLDSLHNGSNYLSLAMPVRVRQARPEGCREFTKPRYSESQMLHLVNVARVSLNLSIKLSDTAPGSSHSRRELIL